MPNNPHFDLPFRKDATGHLAVVEQDSLADVENCVEAVLRTSKGSRLYVPNFGIDDPTFEIAPIDIASIARDIVTNEPRAQVILDQVVSDLVDQVNVRFQSDQ